MSNKIYPIFCPHCLDPMVSAPEINDGAVLDFTRCKHSLEKNKACPYYEKDATDFFDTWRKISDWNRFCVSLSKTIKLPKHRYALVQLPIQTASEMLLRLEDEGFEIHSTNYVMLPITNEQMLPFLAITARVLREVPKTKIETEMEAEIEAMKSSRIIQLKPGGR